MPTRTFLNLPKEKRLRVLRAAKKEFSRVPLEKAVIANIVKDADIPRGSFYQYFYDVDDLFVYVLEYMYGIDRKKFMKFLNDTNGDVYEALKIRFADEIDKLSSEDNRQFKINAITTLLNQSDDQNGNFSKLIPSAIEKQNQVDLSYFPVEVQKQKNFNNFMNIVKMVGNVCVQKYITKQANEDEIKNYYNDCIDFVKSGLQ